MRRIDTEIRFGQHFSAELVISDLDGQNEIRRIMHSFTKNFLQNIRRSFLYQYNSTTQDWRRVKDTTGASVPVNATYDNLFYQPTNQSNPYHGIVLGTGTPIRNIEMLSLGNALGSESLKYIETPQYSSTGVFNTTTGGVIIISKGYKNITDGDLNITEIGFSHYHNSTYALFSHDVYNPPIVLTPGQAKRFSIQINISPTMPKQFYDILCSGFMGSAINSKLTDGTTKPVSPSTYGYRISTSFYFNVISDNNILGLFIGSNDSLPNNSDYTITSVSSRVGNTAVPQVIVDNNECYLEFTNVFLNASYVSDINVNQIGIYVGYDTSNRLMPFRQVFPQKITMQPLEQIEAHFKIKISFQ